MSHPDPSQLSFYARPTAMTSAGRYGSAFGALPRDVGALAAIAHGLLIHGGIMAEYGVRSSNPEPDSAHLRRVEQLLEQILARDDRPLRSRRTPANRVIVNCRHFTVFMVSMLRAQGISARARCGFGNYFGNKLFEDHWVCEYWHTERQRWILVDAQIDSLQKGLFGVDFDVTDVPRDRFLVAGEAWARCRSGAADPQVFGLSTAHAAGYWWIAGNVMRDAAALDTVELLPWDVWGAMPSPGAKINDAHQMLFDQLAAFTQTPDDTLTELRRLCHDDDRLRVPPVVHNRVRHQDEVI